MNVKLTIEEVFGDKTTILLLTVEECKPDTRNTAIQTLLETARIAFPPTDPPDAMPTDKHI